MMSDMLTGQWRVRSVIEDREELDSGSSSTLSSHVR